MAIPLYESVLSSMRDKISSRDWVAGDLIPREVDLCKQYGVSRSTIRMAMSRLVEENCDKIVSLPMKGHIDSLNASVAAGILLYAVAGARA